MTRHFATSPEAVQKQIAEEKKNNIYFGQAVVVGLPCGKRWALPGGEVTTSRNRSQAAAREIHRLMQVARA